MMRLVGAWLVVLSVGCCLVGNVAEAAWSAPSVVSSAGSFATEPQVGLDGSGDAVAAWNQQFGTGGSTMVVSVRGAHASRWSSPQSLYRVSAGTAFDPQVAVAASGAAVVAWQAEGTGGAPAIEAVFRGSASAPWSVPARIGPGLLDGAKELGIDRGGNAVLVYVVGFGGTEMIDASMLDMHSGTWSTPVVLGRSTSELPNPQVAVAPAGEAVAVWSSARRPPRPLWPGVGGADRFDSWVQAAVRPARSSRWHPAERLGRETQFIYDVDFTASPSGPQVVVDSRGAAIAVWQYNPTARRLVTDAATFDSRRFAWRPLSPLSTREAQSPRVVSSPAGWITLAWENRSSGLATRSGPINGCCWTRPTTFAGNPRAFDFDIQLVAGPGRSAALGFSRSNLPIELAIHPRNGTAWLEPVSLGLGPGHGRSDAIMQALTVGPGGQLLAAWTQVSLATTPGRLDATLYTATSTEP
jgi:hypothetical protein